MRWRTEHTTAVALLIGLSLPALTVWAALHTSAYVTNARAGARPTLRVASQLQQVELQMSSANSEVRAYVLHPGGDNLKNYQAALKQVDTAVASIRQLAVGNSTLQPSVDALAGAVRDCAAINDRVLALRAGGQATAALALEDSEEALNASLAVRQRADATGKVQQSLATARGAQVLQAYQRWLRWFWAACIASVATVLVCFIVLILQVRSRRKTQEALAEQHLELEAGNQRYNHLIANIPSAVWRLRQHGGIEYVSSRMEEILGYSEAQLGAGQGDFWRDRVHPDDRTLVDKTFQRLFDGAEPLNVEYRVHHANGDWVWVQVQSDHAFGPPSDRSADGVLTDVTIRKRLEQAERQRRETELHNREMETANRVKSEFLASVSHELRTPLSAVLGFSDLMLQQVGGDLNPDQMGFVGHIHSAGKHLLDLVTDILDLARLEAGQLHFTPEWLEFEPTAAESLQTVQPPAMQKSIRLQCRIEPGLKIWGDPLRVRQILINLLSNAVKFTPNGGDVLLTAQADGDHALICVADTGIGIAPEHLETIFERFRQVGPGPSGVKEGTGLGLAITRQLVHMHHGDIRVESQPGGGSRFLVNLPLSVKGVRTADARLTASRA